MRKKITVTKIYISISQCAESNFKGFNRNCDLKYLHVKRIQGKCNLKQRTYIKTANENIYIYRHWKTNKIRMCIFIQIIYLVTQYKKN